MTWLTFAVEHWFLTGLVLVVLYYVSYSIWLHEPHPRGVRAQPRQGEKIMCADWHPCLLWLLKAFWLLYSLVSLLLWWLAMCSGDPPFVPNYG